MTDEIHLRFLQKAIEKAEESVMAGGFPAGAVIVKDNKIIGEGISIGFQLCDPTSHGEMASIRDACKTIKASDLSGAMLYASMQPCIMCLGAAMWSGLSEIFFACSRDHVSAEYYGGHYNSDELNQSFLRPIKLTHIKELEAKSLAILRRRESLLNT